MPRLDDYEHLRESADDAARRDRELGVYLEWYLCPICGARVVDMPTHHYAQHRHIPYGYDAEEAARAERNKRLEWVRLGFAVIAFVLAILVLYRFAQ